MNSEYIDLAYKIKEFINEENKKEQLKKGEVLLQQLVKKLIGRGCYEFPSNISELINYLRVTPMKEYLDDEDSHNTAIYGNLELTEEFSEKVLEKNAIEAGQKLMYELLKYIRKSDLEDKENIYREIRKFILENYYIPTREFDIKIEGKYNDKIYNMLNAMYHKENNIEGEYKLCPVCGKKINLKDFEDGRCSKVCNYYINKKNLKPKTVIFKDNILELNEGIHKYNLMSSIGEFEIYNKCLERFKSKTVELYPNVDEYDISIKDLEKNISINLDIKDVKTPERLVKILLENTKISKLENNREGTFNYIVIPEHREFIYNKENAARYTKDLKKLINDKKLGISVIRERNLYQEIERRFEEV